MQGEDEFFKTFRYDRGEPVPAELLRHMASGSQIVEIDEKLFFHIKFHFRSLIFYESPRRFGIRVGPNASDIAEFTTEYVAGQEKFFLKPPGLVEN